jgi:hypothetical protein
MWEYWDAAIPAGRRIIITAYQHKTIGRSLTGSMCLTQNRIHVQALKIVTHCSLYRQLLRVELGTATIFDNVLRSQRFTQGFSYLGAAITVGIGAWPDLAQKIHSFAQVSIIYSINLNTFRRLRNHGQATDIVLAWDGCN